MDRLTSMGLSNTADKFLQAAKCLRSTEDTPSVPSYFLLCQSIELSLKAFLRGSGSSEDQLKKIGHNLKKALKKARAKDLERHCVVSDEQEAALRMINSDYRGKDLQYTKSGYKTYPDPQVLLDLAETLYSQTRQFCCENRKRHFGEATEVS